jgi:putative membrane protein
MAISLTGTAASQAAPTPVVPAANRDARMDWACERTLLAWIRTGLAIMAFGFMIGRAVTLFGAHDAQALGNGGALMMAIGCFVTVMGAWRFVKNHRSLVKGEQVDPSPGGPVMLALAISAVGAALAFSMIGP